MAETGIWPISPGSWRASRLPETKKAIARCEFWGNAEIPSGNQMVRHSTEGVEGTGRGCHNVIQSPWAPHTQWLSEVRVAVSRARESNGRGWPRLAWRGRRWRVTGSHLEERQWPRAGGAGNRSRRHWPQVQGSAPGEEDTGSVTARRVPGASAENVWGRLWAVKGASGRADGRF